MQKRLLVPSREAKLKKIQVEELDILPEENLDMTMQNCDCFYYTISGFGRLQVDVYGYSLASQSAVFIPAGDKHSISNSGNITMRLVRYSTTI